MSRMPLLLAICASAFGQPGGALTGRVVSTLRNEPVAGAQVTLRGVASDKPQTYITQTDALGRFSISNILPGVYEPRPAKSGYEQRTPDRFATAADFPPVTIEAGKPAGPVVLHLIPDSVVAGRVLDADGDPVRRATVELQRYQYVAGKKQLQGVRTAQTDDLGQYRLFHVPPGKYFLHVDPQQGGRMMFGGMPVTGDSFANGLGPVFYPDSPDAGHATELELAPGAEIDGIDLRLAPTRLYSIRGKLETSENGWNVFAQRLEGTFRAVYPTRYENGDYIVQNLPPGKYVISGQIFPPRNKTEDPGTTKYAREVVEIVDRNLEHVDLTFEPAVKIAGIVQGDNGASPQNVNGVNLSPPEPVMQGASAQVKKDGTFSVDVAPGIYYLRAIGPRVYVKSVLTGKDPLPDRTIDTAHLSGDLTVIVSADFGKVEGKVLDDTGKPVYNADVTLIPDQSRSDWQERFRSALTKFDGSFSFANIEPGDYRVYSWLAVEQGAPQDAEFRKPYEDRAIAIKVASGSSQTLELKVISAK